MSDMFLEIVELDDGQIALRRADSDDEPIMRITFSEEVRDQLDDDYIDVAKVMMTAGIHMITDLNGKALSETPDTESADAAESAPQPRVIH